MHPQHHILGRLFSRNLTRATVVLSVSAMALTGLASSTPASADSYKGAQATTPTAACPVTPILVNSCRPWLGAFSSGYTTNGQVSIASNFEAQILGHETRIGRQLDIVRDYYGPSATKLNQYDKYFAQRPNTILELMWNPVNSWGDIASVTTEIDSMAASIKALVVAGSNPPVTPDIILSIWHEPENNVSPGGDVNCPSLHEIGNSGTVAQYRNMWAYVENQFALEGVTNVVWAMDYMNYKPWLCLVNDLYPGDNLIDWVIFNAYGDTKLNKGAPSFDFQVNQFYKYLEQNSNAAHDYLSKAWGIAEWGIYEAGGTAAQDLSAEEGYYTQGMTALDDDTYPRVKIYTQFDAKNPLNGHNYRVAYDDSDNTYDPTKGSFYDAFAQDPRLTDAYYTPTGVKPIKPTGLTAVPISNDEIDLSWNPASDPADVTGYDIYRNGVQIAVTTVATDATSPTTYLDAGTTATPLIASTQYAYTVTAVGPDGTSGHSSSVSATTLPSPLGAPTGLTASAETNGEVQLSWAAPSGQASDVTGYYIYRADQGSTPIATVTADPAGYDDATVAASTDYTYTVAAYDAAGTGPPSLPANIETP